jgi:hypothetical protein
LRFDSPPAVANDIERRSETMKSSAKETQLMATRGFLPSVFLGVVLSVLASCSSQTEQPPSAVPEETLSPERAKKALLEMIRSKPGKDLGWFEGDIPDEMAKMNIEEIEDGWYAWTGAFRVHPSKAIYTFVVRPQPGAQACVFEYKGSFVNKEGQWSATPPELASTALQTGK